jgi:acyl-coenzyme A synthetase/AMP-(fatty) acid ligase
MTMNAASILLQQGAPQRIAIACGDECLTYEALRESTARAASAWRRRGLARGERVAIKLSDGSSWVRAFLGTIWTAGVAVPVNPHIPDEDWRSILGEKPFRFILAESREEAPPEFRDSVVVLDDWVREVEDAPPVAPEAVEQDTPAFWTHSSGTSGRPKAVVHAHRFACSVEAIADRLLGLTAADRFYASSKLFFAYPLGNSLFAGLKLGGTVILDPQWPTAASVAATIAAQKPTVFFSVPSLYRNLLKAGFARELVEHGVRVFVSAGEVLAPGLRSEWRKQAGVSIVNGYGASETLSLALLNPGEGDELSPTPGFEVQSLNPRDDGAPTRIRIDAPTLAIGYWNRPDADAEHFREGAFCPADLFEHTGANTWRFAGREDSLVKIRGRWVNLAMLEDRLAIACPSIAEAAATACPDDDGVAAIVFFYVLRSDAAAGAENALHAFAETFLPHHQRPRWLRAVPSLPRTATGKLLRRKLLEVYPLRAADEAGSAVTAAF